MDTTIPFSTSVREFQDECFALGSAVNRNDRDLYASGKETEDAVLVSCKNLREECFEFIDALNGESKENVLKEACDVLYVLFGALARFGLDRNIIPAFNRVHENNMLKLKHATFENGKLIKAKDHPKAKLGDLVEASCSF